MSDAPFMLKIRVEGQFVNCYIAPHGAELAHLPMILIGTMNRRVMEADPKLFDEWKEIMKRVLVISVREALGVELDIDAMHEEPGPENERAPGGSGH